MSIINISLGVVKWTLYDILSILCNENKPTELIIDVKSSCHVLLQGHVSRVRCISLYGDQILSGSDDRSAKLWSASSSSSTALTTLSGHAWPVTQVCLSRQLAITADSCSVRVWSLPDGIILQTLGDQANVVEMLIDPQSQLLLLCDSKGDVKSINIRKNSDNKNNDQDKKLKRTKQSQKGSTIVPKWSQNSPKVGPKMVPKLVQKWFQNDPNMVP